MMVRIEIDNQRVEVPAGSSILDAARKLGLDIPSLCFADGCRPNTSCMLCLVKVGDEGRLVPSCATPAEDGMSVSSETDEIREIRKAGLELLLSDHLGDCSAPCQHTCPTHMNIPLMLRQVGAGLFAEAIVTIKRDIALPAVLGRVCPDLCERTCRRGDLDHPAAICLVKRHVADVDLAFGSPYLPSCRASTGKSVAIVGAGPTGLSAAFHLQQLGHACTLFDDRAEPGGMLRVDYSDDQLPRDVLAAEVEVIKRLGARFLMNTTVGREVAPANLGKDFDAVLLAVGALDQDAVAPLGVRAHEGRIWVGVKNMQTSQPGVFSAGNAVGPGKLAVRSVAAGKAAAGCIDQYLTSGDVVRAPKPFAVRAGRMSPEELVQLSIGASGAERVTPALGISGGLTPDEARAESLRCLHCDCGQQGNCTLQHYAQLYGASATRYRSQRRSFERHARPGLVNFEPGKCILCGLCVQVATQAGEPIGLTFIGRGFDVRIGAPFDHSIDEGLELSARQCAEVCPTGALTMRDTSETDRRS